MKYVASAAIENKLNKTLFIESGIVVGPERQFVVALIVPAFQQLSAWCQQHQLAADSNETMIAHPEVLQFYREIVDAFNEQFNHVEQVKKFRLLPHEWSIVSGELTPKLSIKRKVILEKYQSYIDEIYS